MPSDITEAENEFSPNLNPFNTHVVCNSTFVSTSLDTVIRNVHHDGEFMSGLVDFTSQVAIKQPREADQ